MYQAEEARRAGETKFALKVEARVTMLDYAASAATLVTALQDHAHVLDMVIPCRGLLQLECGESHFQAKMSRIMGFVALLVIMVIVRLPHVPLLDHDLWR